MQWIKLANALRAAVQVPRVKGPTGTIWMPEEPFNLEEAVAVHLETDEERQRFEQDGALGVLGETWSFEPLLQMYWEGDPQASPSFRMGMLDAGHARGYVCLALGAPAWWVVAAIEPKDSREYLAAFVKDFLEANGDDYHLTLFGVLPALVQNLAPGRLSAHLLKECLWEWMENAQDMGLAKWDDLRDDLLGGLRPVGDDEQAGAMLDALGGLVYDQAEEGDEEDLPALLLPVEECRYLLNLYFGIAYRSSEPFPGQAEALKLLNDDPDGVVERLRNMRPVA